MPQLKLKTICLLAYPLQCLKFKQTLNMPLRVLEANRPSN